MKEVSSSQPNDTKCVDPPVANVSAIAKWPFRLDEAAVSKMADADTPTLL